MSPKSPRATRARLAHQGVEAVHEGHRRHGARLLGATPQVGRVADGRRDGLLADDLLAGGERRRGELVMGGVRGEDVHDVHLLVGDDRQRVGAGALEAVPAGERLRRGAGAGRHRHEACARPACGAGVHLSHEAGADEADGG
jgi:hypothetical protein